MKDRRSLTYLICGFFVFASLFPTLRLLLIGNQSSASMGEYLFSSLPDLFAGVILLITFLHMLRHTEEIRFKPFDWVVMAFIVTNVITGMIISGDLLISLYGFRLSYYPMLFYFVLRFSRPETIQSSMKGIFYWILLIGLIGIVLYFCFAGFMVYMLKLNQTEVPTYFVVRMTSLFWSPVVFASVIAAGFLYFYYQFVATGRWINYLFMALLMFCIVMAMSRGVMIAILLSFIVLSAVMRDWKKSFWSLVLIVAVFCITAFYITSPGEVFFWLADSTVETVGLKKGVTRVDLWIHAFENFREHPLGFGLGKSGHVAARFFTEKSAGADIYSTDGWFLKIMNETGLWGLISYLVMSVNYGILYLRRKTFRDRKGILLLFFAIFVMVNIQNLVSNVLDFYLFSFLYWMIIGASVKILYEQARQ